jgi:hypothetical protein
MYLRGEQLFERERPERERARSPAHSGADERCRGTERKAARGNTFFFALRLCATGRKAGKRQKKHHPRCCPLCVYVCACELIKNLVVMINANYFFFYFSGRAVCAANFIENQSDERRSARVLRGVTRPCPLCLSALSTRLSRAK